jgi:hypothetical protein|tara:strand:+ start:4924 stop:5229 length:306 start_codon:yes stop_codon:yes gene_type:complete
MDATLAHMKSAYELAMERFSDPESEKRTPLTKEQKDALAETDRVYAAKIAEKEVFLQKQIHEARESGDEQALEQIEAQLRNERARFEDQKEAAKDKIRADA